MARSLLFIGVALALASACAETPMAPQADGSLFAAGAAPVSLSRATGSGHFLDDRLGEPALRTFSFTALQYDDVTLGATGEWHLTSRAYGISLHGKVECLSVAGNEAWFEGPVTQSDDPTLIGVYYAFRVIDNGEGGTALDEVSYAVPFPVRNLWCTARPAALTKPIEEGNVQVH